MDKLEFINKVIGLPWVNRASNFEAVDCWGLVILYYKHVLNISLPIVEGYSERVQISECWENETQTGRWQQVEKPQMEGLVFTCYNGGIPSHVGLTIGGGKVLHTTGGMQQNGTVQVNSIKAIERIYGRMTYHKFTG